MHQGRLLFSLVLLALAVPCVAADSLPALNCKLSQPPASAGEEFDHGVTLRVYRLLYEAASRCAGLAARGALPDRLARLANENHVDVLLLDGHYGVKC